MHVFTSESVGEGHPDKICDQISDTVLDTCLAADPNSRVACETFTTTGMVLVGGEVTTTAHLDVPGIARDVLKRIGYDRSAYGIDYHTCAVLNVLDRQSADIAMGVDEGSDKPMGAGDQGLMFGYACTETEQLMPAPVDFSHRIMRRAAEQRKSGALPFLAPDGKCQVSVVYDGDTPQRIETVVLSHQHDEDVSSAKLREALIEQVIKPALPAKMLDGKVTYHINPTGRFVIGGPHGDAGLTGRKIIVDTYGGMARHGGGAFSGKDPSKVDRSACYMARHIAKNVVAAGLAARCEVQLAYAIGVAEPVSVYVATFGTGTVDEQKISDAITSTFDLTPAGIISYLDLRRPIYRETVNYGHFGRPGFSWEETGKAQELKAAV